MYTRPLLLRGQHPSAAAVGRVERDGRAADVRRRRGPAPPPRGSLSLRHAYMPALHRAYACMAGGEGRACPTVCRSRLSGSGKMRGDTHRA